MLIAICIIMLLIVYKMRGMFVFLASLLVFATFTVFGLFFSLSGLIPLLSDFLSNRVDFITGVVRTVSYLVSSLTGFLSAVIVFYLLTSEDLNSYLGTEAIFPIRRKIFVLQELWAVGIEAISSISKKKAKFEEHAGEKLGEEEIVIKSFEEKQEKVSRKPVADELREAFSLIEKEEYAKAVKLCAEILRRKIIKKFGLSESLTNDEIIEKLSEFKHNVDLELIRRVLLLGEKCEYGKYEPSKEEAEEAISFSNDILLAIS